MKVCLLNVELEVNAGTERLVATHANAMKNKHDVEIACAYYKPSVFPEDFKEFKIIEYAKGMENTNKARRTRVSLSLLKRKTDFLKKYDAIICYRPYTNVLAMRAKRKHGMKTLWYCSHPEKHLYPKYFHTLTNKAFILRTMLLPGLRADQKSIKEIDRTWVNSHHMWMKVNMIYNYNQHKVLYPPAGKLLKKSQKGDYVLSVSRIEPAKNQLLLLKALRLVKPRVKAAIIGKATDPGYYKKLKDYVKKHKLRVEFPGELSDKDIQSWYNKSFLNVYTSVDEDFGIVPLESISSGKPSLTHVSNGVSEVLPHRYVFSDTRELADKIVSVKEDRMKKLTSYEKELPNRIKEQHLTEVMETLKNRPS